MWDCHHTALSLIDNVKHTVVVEVLDDRGNDVMIKNKDTYADVVKGNRSKKII